MLNDYHHFSYRFGDNPIACGLKVKTVPEGIWVEHYINQVTCPACIKAAFADSNIVSYVWGRVADEIQRHIGKVHCVITFQVRTDREWEYVTLCGRYDTPGFWEFADKQSFLSEDGCQKCQSVFNRLQSVKE